MNKAQEILRKHNVNSFTSVILGTCLGELVDKKLDDLEILTVVEELLKLRSLIESKAMIDNFNNQMKIIEKHLEKED